jgi:hypothetical protein
MRACALEPQLRQAIPIGDEPACEFLVLAIEELFAGKIKAMIDRRHPPPPDYHVRDLEEEKRQKERSEIAVTHPESFAGLLETRDAKSGVTDGVLLWATTELRQSTEYLSLLKSRSTGATARTRVARRFVPQG